MTEEVLKFTKLTFIIHFVIVVLYGILYWLPEINAPLYGITYTAPLGALNMLLGSVMFGFAVGDLCCILAKEWKAVKIYLIAEVVTSILMLIALFMNLTVFNALIYMAIVAIIILIVLFCLTVLQQEDKIKTLWK
ncbi:MAG: hypothetical protein ACXAC5_19280 [Promethearchaeota archaeon]|jgi:hypothetical protein